MPLSIFFCYDPKDQALQDELATHLSALRRLRHITSWRPCDMQAGIEWAHEIETRISTANLVLLLVSPDFMASDDCYNGQLQLAVDRERAGIAQIIPIIVRPVLWEGTPIEKYRHLALPAMQKPVTLWSNRDEAWLNVAQGIGNIIKKALTPQALSANETLVLDHLGFDMPSPTLPHTVLQHGIVLVKGLICPKCGFQNRPGAKFCKRDGQPLTLAASPPPPQVHARTVARSPIRARPAALVGAPSGNSDAVYQLGLQQLNNKNYVEAVNQFKLAQSLGKQAYDVLYNLGRAYRQYGLSVRDKDKKLFTENMTLAAEQFEQAIKVKPYVLDACFQLGICYHDLALYPQSTAAFQKALQLAPRDTAIYYQLGMVAMAQSYKREAEAYFLEGLKINPDHGLILTALGRLYIEMNQVPSAINVLRQATQLDPFLADGWYELGRAHMKERKWQLALNAFEQARQQGLDTVQIYTALASCYLKTNKKAQARQMVQEALQRDSNNTEAIRLQIILSAS